MEMGKGSVQVTGHGMCEWGQIDHHEIDDQFLGVSQHNLILSYFKNPSQAADRRLSTWDMEHHAILLLLQV
jgi:hypothetical protein